jgi:arylsulfatase A-like enzyme
MAESHSLIPQNRVRWLLLLAIALLAGCTLRTPVRPHVLFLVIDSLRSDHLGFAGYGRPVSPCLDSLAASGAAFTDCVAQAPFTQASVPSMLTGLYPSSCCYTTSVRLPGAAAPTEAFCLGGGVASVAEILRRHGHATGAFTASPVVSTKILGLRNHFDTFDGSHECTTGECARAINDRALQWLDGLDEKPWFCYIHYMDVHHPYGAPAEWARRFSRSYGRLPEPNLEWMTRHNREPPPPGELEHIVGMYDAEIAYLDHEICRLLRELRRRVPGEDILIVVASDHGEEFQEHGGFGHCRTLFEELTRCPLILVWRGRIAPRPAVRRVVQNVDIVPTIMDLLGIASPAELQGTSLAPLLAGEVASRPAFSEKQGVSIRQRGWKLWEEQGGRRRLYNLTEDPQEMTNLCDAEPDTLDALLSYLSTWKSGLPPPSRHPQALAMEEVDSATVAMLRELGYME